MQERKRFQSCSTLASNSEPAGCYTELLKLIAQAYRRMVRKLSKTYYKTRGLQKINPEKSLSLRKKKTKKKGMGTNALPSKSQQNQVIQQQSQLQLQHQQQQLQQQQQQQFIYAVHHHQHQHLLPAPSPNPSIQQQASPSPYPHQNCPSNLTPPEGSNQALSHQAITPQAPRASPEQSDIDSSSSARVPNYLVLPSSNYSLNPSSESLATSHFSTDPFSPAFNKSQQISPHHLSACYGGFCLSRASSANSGVSGAGRILPSLPEVLAAQGAKHAALAASNLLLNLKETESLKTQSVADKG